jgi:hypothetical protein
MVHFFLRVWVTCFRLGAWVGCLGFDGEGIAVDDV